MSSPADQTNESGWASGADAKGNATNTDGFAALAILALTVVLVIVAINAFV